MTRLAVAIAIYVTVAALSIAAIVTFSIEFLTPAWWIIVGCAVLFITAWPSLARRLLCP